MFKYFAKRRPLAIGAALTLTLAGCASQNSETALSVPAPATSTLRSGTDVVAGWPAKQRETAALLIAKYGQPTVVGDRMIAWFDKGPFVKTVLMRDAQQHNFPMPHPDYLTQSVKHSVPSAKLGALADYDGSVWFHRTRGELSAQCDKEEMNVLALNLSHDIITGKRSVADARAFYAQTAMAFMKGDRSSAYVTGLIFPTEPNAADPDRAAGM